MIRTDDTCFVLMYTKMYAKKFMFKENNLLYLSKYGQSQVNFC